MSKRQDVKDALEEEEEEEGRETPPAAARSFHCCSTAEETDAISLPRKTFLNSKGIKKQSCVFRGTARNPPPESALRNI